MVDEHTKNEHKVGRRDFLKGLGALAAGSATEGCELPTTERITLEEFRKENPELDWVGTKDRAGNYQFGGLGSKLEYVELPEGSNFSPADFTGTSPKGISARGADLRGSTFDSQLTDFADFDASGTKLGGAYMPDADIRFMVTDSKTSFYDPAHGAALLTGSNAEYKDLTGNDLRYVDIEGGRWAGVQVDENTKTLGMNVAYADLTDVPLHRLREEQLLGMQNLDLAVGVDPALVQHWLEGNGYARNDDAQEPKKSWVERHQTREAERPSHRTV